MKTPFKKNWGKKLKIAGINKYLKELQEKQTNKQVKKTFQDLKIKKKKTIKKIQMEGIILKVKNLCKWMGTMDASISIRNQVIEEINLRGWRYDRNIDSLVKENVQLKNNTKNPGNLGHCEKIKCKNNRNSITA